MKAFKVLTTIIAVFAAITSTMAEDTGQSGPLSLQDCIDIALKNQTDIIVAQNNLDIAKARVTQARGAYFPHLTLENNAFTIGSDGGLIERRTGTAISVTQNIFDGGLREANKKSAIYGVMQSRAGLDRTTQLIKFQVTQAYYEMLRSKRLLDVANANVKYNQALKEMVETRAELGDAAKADVYPVDAQLANAQVSVISAKNQVQASAIQLQNVMGLSPQPGFDIQDVPVQSLMDIQPLETYISAALSSRPEISQAAANLGAAQTALKSSKILLYPRPVITGQYQMGVSGVDSSSPQIFGGLVYDIFDGGSNRAAYKQSKAALANAEQQSMQVKKDIEADVQTAYLNLVNSKERLSASEVSLTAAQKNYDVQSEKYKQGLAIPLDLLNAELQVVTAQTNEVEARYDYYTAIAQLEFAVGKQEETNGK